MAAVPVTLCIPDLGNIKTLTLGAEPGIRRAYTLIGRNTRDTLANKTLIDPSNTIAASQIIIDGVAHPINGGAAIGEVLTRTVNGLEFQPGGGGPATELATTTTPVSVDDSPAPTDEGFVLSSFDSGGGVFATQWTINPVNNIRMNFTATGNSAVASGQDSFAIGANAEATGLLTYAVGPTSIATGLGANAHGLLSTASGTLSQANGILAVASGPAAVAIGPVTNATAEDTVCVGNTLTASAVRSMCIGAELTANVPGSIVIGNGTNTVYPVFGDASNSSRLAVAANDVAAAGLGVPIGAIYREPGGILRERVS